MNGHFNLGDIHPYRYFFCLAVGLGLAFTFVSSDSGRPLWSELIQWQCQTLIPISILILSHTLLLRLTSFGLANVWLQLCLSAVVGCLFFAPLALFMDIFFEVQPLTENLLTGIFEEYVGILPPVTLTWLLMNFPLLSGYQYRKESAPENTKKTSDQLPSAKVAFLAKTPFNNLSDIISISAELHYIDVKTESAHQLVLYSFQQAITELPQHLGMQTHRSYWVAYAAIRKITKSGRQGCVFLLNGDQIPVSRSKWTEFTRTFSEYQGNQ